VRRGAILAVTALDPTNKIIDTRVKELIEDRPLTSDALETLALVLTRNTSSAVTKEELSRQQDILAFEVQQDGYFYFERPIGAPSASGAKNVLASTTYYFVPKSIDSAKVRHVAVVGSMDAMSGFQAYWNILSVYANKSDLNKVSQLVPVQEWAPTRLSPGVALALGEKSAIVVRDTSGNEQTLRRPAVTRVTLLHADSVGVPKQDVGAQWTDSTGPHFRLLVRLEGQGFVGMPDNPSGSN
jgi:hypothetical protein